MLPFWPFVLDGLRVLFGADQSVAQVVLSVLILIIWTPVVFWLWGPAHTDGPDPP